MGCSGIKDESLGLEKNTKGSIMIHTHAATLVLIWTIFFFNGLHILKPSQPKLKGIVPINIINR